MYFAGELQNSVKCTTSESTVQGSRYTWLDQIEKVFLVLREKFSDYFYQYGLYRVMPEVILPRINKTFRKENGNFIDQSKEMRKGYGASIRASEITNFPQARRKIKYF